MSHTITPASTWHATHTAFSDGDPVAEASSDGTWQSLADNDKYIYDTVGINGSANLVKTASAANTSPITYTGNGSGAGGVFTGGATGNGLTANGGASGGDGVVGTANGGNGRGATFTGNGTGNGVRGTGGATGVGVRGVGGATSGAGGQFTGTAGNAQGVIGTGNGTGEGGAFTGGSGNAVGVRGTGNGTGQGGYFVSNGSGGTQSAVVADASASASGRAVVGIGGSSGRGFYTTGSIIGIEANGTSRGVQGITTGSSLASTDGGVYAGASNGDAPAIYASVGSTGAGPALYTNQTTGTTGPDLLLEPRSSAPSGAQARKGAIYMNTDGHLYVHNGSTWVAAS